MTTGRAPRLRMSPTLSPVFRLLPDGNCKPRLGEAQRNLSKAGRSLVRFVKQNGSNLSEKSSEAGGANI